MYKQRSYHKLIVVIKQNAFYLQFRHINQRVSKELFIKQVGERIREIRKEKKLSLGKMSLLSDIKKSNLSRIESGKTNITLGTLYTISQVLKVPVCSFFNDLAE